MEEWDKEMNGYLLDRKVINVTEWTKTPEEIGKDEADWLYQQN
jgi:hypothetical protein